MTELTVQYLLEKVSGLRDHEQLHSFCRLFHQRGWTNGKKTLSNRSNRIQKGKLRRTQLEAVWITLLHKDIPESCLYLLNVNCLTLCCLKTALTILKWNLTCDIVGNIWKLFNENVSKSVLKISLAFLFYNLSCKSHTKSFNENVQAFFFFPYVVKCSSQLRFAYKCELQKL